MIYEGVSYHYAFEFNAPYDSGIDDEIFRIIISKYRNEYKDFSGLCLNNELKIISQKDYPVAAFFDIVSKIINFTISDRKAYASKHENSIPTPLRSVKDEKIIEKFEKSKYFDEYLLYNKQLSALLRKAKNINEYLKSSEDLKSIEDLLNLVYFSSYINNLIPNLKIRKIFTI
jgi:superfamily I DNA/RNA helicase